MERGTRGAPIERAPEPPRGMGADLEIIIQRQFGSVRRADDRRLSQPQPMLDAANAHENMPTIRGLPDFAG